MTDGFKNEAEGYAASLRQQSRWIQDGVDSSLELDADELDAAADFIERQQAEIEALKASK